MQAITISLPKTKFVSWGSYLPVGLGKDFKWQEKLG